MAEPVYGAIWKTREQWQAWLNSRQQERRKSEATGNVARVR